MGITTSSNSSATYVPIQSQTLASNQAAITFSSIPATYTNLELVISGYFTGTTYGNIRLNGETSGGNYYYTRIYASGGGAASDGANSGDGIDLGNASTGNVTLKFFNYANATTYKTILARVNNTSTPVVYVYLWKATPAAINQIVLNSAGAGNFVAGTTATLYGILAA